MKRTSIVESTTYTRKETPNQNSWRGASDVPCPNVLIVRMPSREIARAGRIIVQSPFRDIEEKRDGFTEFTAKE